MTRRFDVVVLGGGVNGLGVGALAARRGYSVLVLERADIGSGTTSASSRLIHGGLRYLQHGEFGLVRESLRERAWLTRTYPHLVRPVRFLLPIYADRGLPAWKAGAGLGLYDLLAHDRLFPGSELLSPRDIGLLRPELNSHGLQCGFAYSDGQITFPERLCVELRGELLESHGACRTYHETVWVRRERDGWRLGVVDRITDAELEVEAGVVLNAAGPWIDSVNRALGIPAPKLIGGTRGSHLVLPQRPGGPGPGSFIYAPARTDGRPFFILPWDGRVLVGTTDVSVDGDPAGWSAEPWEWEYLLRETNALFPEAGFEERDVEYRTVGVRPLAASTLSSSSGSTGGLTRRHFLVDYGQVAHAPGMAAMVGGKLTTFGSFADECVRWIDHTLGTPADGGRHRHFPMDSPPPFAARAAPGGLAARYPPEVVDALDQVTIGERSNRRLASPLPYRAGEVLHAARAEGARTVEDVMLRRLVVLPPNDMLRTAIRKVSETHQLGLVDEDSIRQAT